MVCDGYPTDYKNGNAVAAKIYSDVVTQRNAAIDAYRDRFASKKPEPSKEDIAKYSPVDVELKGLETAFAAFQTLLTGSNGPTIQYGASLLSAIGDKPFDVLTIATAAIAGGDRANTYFLLNIFVPAPHHSYNGGATVVYTIRNEDGFYKSSDTLRMIYGYTKWRPPSLHKKSDEGYNNFQWNKAERNDGSIHWWRY